MPRDSTLHPTVPERDDDLADFIQEDMLGLDDPQPEEDPRDLEELQSLVKRAVEESLQWREEHLDPELEKATDYYHGRPYGDEREGRSQVVTTEVRNSVRSMLPSLLKVFTSSERVVEFKPRDAEGDVAVAAQQTDYVNYIFQEDNPGFLILHSTIKDALLRKLGIIKWWWEEKETVEGSEHTGLTEEDVQLLEQDPYIEVVELDRDETSGTMNVRLMRRSTQGKVRVAAVPPEEFVWSPGARGLEDAPMVGQWQPNKKSSDLIAMGVPREMVERNRGKDVRIATNPLAQARRLDEGARSLFEDEVDESQRPCPFGEVYIRYDEDDDGIAELHKVLVVGEACEVWEDSVVDEVPFSVFAVDPEPHTLIGLSTADNTMDLQRIASHVTRGMLDSLTGHLNPAMEVVESEVNMKDVLNQELGRVIRVRRPQMIREIPTEFVGASALGVLGYLREEREDRIGVTRASAGLDADVLQSTTAVAVNATVTAAQQQMELAAKMLAETGMKTLFRGLLKTVVQHQDQARVVRLRNEWVQVDPRAWDAEKDVVVNVALGSGLVEEKLQTLGLIASKQEEHMQQGSPLVDFAEIRATYARMIELMGYRNTNEFFKPFGEQEAAAYAKQQAESQKPSDTEVLEKIEMAKIQARSQEKQAELQVRLAELELDKLRLEREMAVKEADLQIKGSSTAAKTAVERARLSLEAETQAIQNVKALSETRVGE